MPRRFTDATALFADLLDRHETGTENPIAYPDYVSFASVVAADNFIKDLRRAEETGAVRIAMGSGRRRDQVTHVRLVAPAALYRLLARTPIADIAVVAQARLTDGLTLHPGLLDAVSGIVAAWSRAKSWSAFGPQDVDKLRDAVILAQAILEQRHVGMDYRTFSRRIAGESKTLERVEGAVTRLLGSLLDLPLFRNCAKRGGPHPFPRTTGISVNDRELRQFQPACARSRSSPGRDHALRWRISVSSYPAGAAYARPHARELDPHVSLVRYRSGWDLDI